MMSTSTDDLITDGALALLALKSAPSSPASYGYHRQFKEQLQQGPPIARLSTKGVEVVMRLATHANEHPQIVVGRRHSPQPGLALSTGDDEQEPASVDLEPGQNNYVSRQHLKIYYETFEDKFFLRCLGKNGILVDDVLVRMNQEPVELQARCVMRFPSTQIKLLFETIARKTPDHQPEDSELQQQPLTPNKMPSSTTVSRRIDNNGGSHARSNKFFSPCPSPTGTMSAVNSCPTSPRHTGSCTPSDNDFNKPPYSYAQLIVQAIGSVSDRQMTLSGIYSYIQKNYPYYRTADRGWQNSIRHNLSLNRYFLKVPRNHDEPGKGSYWRIEPQSEGKLIEQAFRKRRHRTITTVRSPQPFRSAPPSPTHNGSKDDSPVPNRHGGHGGDLDFASAPNSPSRSEPGSSVSSMSMPTTPSSAAGAPGGSTANGNAFLFPHPAFAQFQAPNPAAAMRAFPSFFFTTQPGVGGVGGGLPGQVTSSPTYFQLPSMQDAYQMPPPPQAQQNGGGTFKRPSLMSDDDDAHSSHGIGNGIAGGGSELKRMKVDSEDESQHSNEESVKSNGVSEVVESVSSMEQQN